MATIIEVQDQKIEHLSEYAEKVLKYGGKLMQCLEELTSKSDYRERSSRKYMDKYRDDYRERYRKPYDEEEFVRYY